MARHVVLLLWPGRSDLLLLDGGCTGTCADVDVESWIGSATAHGTGRDVRKIKGDGRRRGWLSHRFRM